MTFNSKLNVLTKPWNLGYHVYFSSFLDPFGLLFPGTVVCFTGFDSRGLGSVITKYQK